MQTTMYCHRMTPSIAALLSPYPLLVAIVGGLSYNLRCGPHWLFSSLHALVSTLMPRGSKVVVPNEKGGVWLAPVSTLI
jgi:hypothetical protein